MFNMTYCLSIQIQPFDFSILRHLLHPDLPKHYAVRSNLDLFELYLFKVLLSRQLSSNICLLLNAGLTFHSSHSHTSTRGQCLAINHSFMSLPVFFCFWQLFDNFLHIWLDNAVLLSYCNRFVLSDCSPMCIKKSFLLTTTEFWLTECWDVLMMPILYKCLL